MSLSFKNQIFNLSYNSNGSFDFGNSFDERFLISLYHPIVSLLTLIFICSLDFNFLASQQAKNPTNIFIISKQLAAYLDDFVTQSMVLNEIVGASLCHKFIEQQFYNTSHFMLKLSKL